VFNLFLKYGITAKTAMEFVKKFVDREIQYRHMSSVDKLIGIDLVKMCDNNNDLFNTLEPETHYTTTNQLKYTTDILHQAFNEFKQQSSYISLDKLLSKYDGHHVYTYNITLCGFVHIMDTFPPEHITDQMNMIFKKVVLVAVILTDRSQMS